MPPKLTLYEVADAAEVLGVAYRTLVFRIDKLEAEGARTFARTVGGKMILSEADVKYLREHEPARGRPRKEKE